MQGGGLSLPRGVEVLSRSGGSQDLDAMPQCRLVLWRHTGRIPTWSLDDFRHCRTLREVCRVHKPSANLSLVGPPCAPLSKEFFC